MRSTLRSFFALVIVAVLGASAFAVTPAKNKSKAKAPKPTASSMVDGENGMPSPIKPLKPVPPEEMAFRFFKEALNNHGTWLELGEYGRCWRPSNMGERWAPYTDGSWSYSRYGWTWVSNEEFGGIVYHYGRWMRTLQAGWCWVPDLEWAAAWVSWRYGQDVVGWAPLPPKMDWNPTVGVGTWVDQVHNIGPDNYVFCAISDLDEFNMRDAIFHRSENPGCMLHTVNVTNISLFGKSIFCGGPSYNWVASRVKSIVPVVQVVKERSLVKFREKLNESKDLPLSFRSFIEGGKLTLVAPEWGHLVDPRKADALGFTGEEDEKVTKVQWVEGNPEAPLVAPAEPVALVDVPLVTGWELVAPSEKAELKIKVAREVAGLDPLTHPAEPFNPERDIPAGR